MPAAPVRERDELFDDEQAWALGLLERVDDDEVGPMIMTAPVVRLSDTPGAIRFPGRHLGADTREVLRELGRSDVEIDDLDAEGRGIHLRSSTSRLRRCVSTLRFTRWSALSTVFGVQSSRSAISS